jgi:hypothetical protein
MWGVQGTRADAFAAILVGIQKTGVERLRELVPSRTPDAVDCTDCSATGRFDAEGRMTDVQGRRFSVICMSCAGLGWRSQALDLEEVVLDAGSQETSAHD